MTTTRFPAVVASLALLAASACSSDATPAAQASTSVASEAPTTVATDLSTTIVAVTEPPTTVAAEPDPGPTSTVEPEPEPAMYDFSAVSPVVQTFVDDTGLNGAGLVIVDRDDGVIHQEYWGEFTADRVSLIASSSKMMTAGVLMRLHDDGLLDIDAPVADVVEWGADNPDITPAQLLSNSSGLVGLLPNPAYSPYICQYITTGTLQECAATIFSTPDDDADVIAPDTDFRYGGAQWQVAGAVAEAASGMSWAELIEEIYVQPCGLETLAFNNHFGQLADQSFSYPTAFNNDPSTLQSTDNPNMEGGAYISPVDYAQLLLMHLRGGICGDEQVLSPASLARMHGDRVAEIYDGNAYETGTGYGMGWWVDRATGRISDGGAYGTVPWLDVDDGYGAYLVVEADSGTGNRLASQLYDLVEAAVAAGS